MRITRSYDAIGFDLLTALLDTWSLWSDVAGGRELGMRWHAASQAMLRGQPYRPFEDIVRDSAREVGAGEAQAAEMLRRWGEFEPWPDAPGVLEELRGHRRFIVTNCSKRLGQLAARRAGEFELVVTAEEAGAYKPDPRPYRLALERMRLDASRVLFVAGSAHDVGDVAAPSDATAIVTSPDLLRLPELAGRRGSPAPHAA